MKAAVSAMMVRVGDTAFARWCGKVGDILDRAIPIVLAVMAASGIGAVACGLVH